MLKVLLQHLYCEVEITLKFGYLGCSQNNQVFLVVLTTFFCSEQYTMCAF